MKVSEFLTMEWLYSAGPLIEPPPLSPVIADPTFLFPHETPTNEWRLYAHSAWGICEYSSPDGTTWEYHGINVRNAMRPFVRKVRDGTFVLLYEKTKTLALPTLVLPGHRRWKSHIEMRTSKDLVSWSYPQIVLRPQREWMADPHWGDSVSNPCLLETGDSFRLYFSASLAYVDDCGFCEPRYIATATSSSLVGPYIPSDAPIVDPKDDELPGVIGAGSMKVVALEDGYVGLQNKIYHDAENRSRSAIFVLTSADGYAWRSAGRDPIIGPDSGWKRSHVYACDCRLDDRGGAWYLYFNARDGWRISEGKERIGRAIGIMK